MEKSSVTFVGQSSIINHPGRFESFTVKLTPDGAEPHDFTKATLIVTIDTASAKTDAAMLDGHLQKPEFFDSATYPEATFVSMSITHKTGNKYAVTGDLTIKNITKEVAMNVEVNDDKLTLDYEIPRADFEIGKDSYGDKILTATVPLKAEIVFVK